MMPRLIIFVNIVKNHIEERMNIPGTRHEGAKRVESWQTLDKEDMYQEVG